MSYLYGFFPVPREMFILMPRIWGGDGSSGAIQNPVLGGDPLFHLHGHDAGAITRRLRISCISSRWS